MENKFCINSQNEKGLGDAQEHGLIGRKYICPSIKQFFRSFKKAELMGKSYGNKTKSPFALWRIAFHVLTSSSLLKFEKSFLDNWAEWYFAGSLNRILLGVKNTALQ